MCFNLPALLIYTTQATLFGQYRRIMEEDGEAKEDEKEEVKEKSLCS